MKDFLMILFLISFAYLLLDILVHLCFSLIAHYRISKERYKNRMNHKVVYDYYRPVSILISVNNISSLQECLAKISNLDYSQYEVILIGNTEENSSFQKFIQEYHLKKVSKPYRKRLQTAYIEKIYEGTYENIPITLLLKDRTLLVDDYNAGLNVAKYPYILTLSDNIRVYKQTLKKLMQSTMEEENVVASSGIILPKYTKKNFFSFLRYMQATKNHVRNLCFDMWNGNLFFPLTFCLFKKDIILKYNGFSLKNGNTDSCFLARIHVFLKNKKKNYRIRFVGNAICEAVETYSFSSYIEKRKEERFSFLIGIFRQKKLFLHIFYGALSLVTYSYYILFVLFKPFFLLIGSIPMLFLFLIHALTLKEVLIIIIVPLLFEVMFFFIHKNMKNKLAKESVKMKDEIFRINLD